MIKVKKEKKKQIAIAFTVLVVLERGDGAGIVDGGDAEGFVFTT